MSQALIIIQITGKIAFSKFKKDKFNIPKKYNKIYEESVKYYNEMNLHSI